MKHETMYGLPAEVVKGHEQEYRRLFAQGLARAKPGTMTTKAQAQAYLYGLKARRECLEAVFSY